MVDRWSIRTRIVWSFSLLMSVIVVFSGLINYQTTKHTLKSEIGRRLLAVGWTASLSVPVDIVVNFNAGDESSRLYGIVQAKLTEIARVGQVDRIFIADKERFLLVETAPTGRIGSPLYELYPYDLELKRVLRGEMADTPVFKAKTGRYYKRAIVPLTRQGRCEGFVVVESGADSYASVTALGRRILLTVLVGVITTMVLGYLIASRITAPLAKLTLAARNFGAGHLDVDLDPHGLKEVSELACAFEEMRKGIRLRDQNLKSLLAEIAHEIRNALGGIELFAGTLKEDLNHDENAQFSLGRILREVKTINRTITDYLQFARPQTLELMEVDVGDVVREALELSGDRLRSKNIVVNLELDSAMAEASIIDPNQMRQVILNLILNAVDAMPAKGSLLLKVDHDRNGVLLLVGDTGSGIPVELREDIFNPFSSTKPQGAGLGLSVAKRIVEAHGGNIELVNYPNYQTTFRIFIPQKRIQV